MSGEVLYVSVSSAYQLPSVPSESGIGPGGVYVVANTHTSAVVTVTPPSGGGFQQISGGSSYILRPQKTVFLRHLAWQNFAAWQG